MKDLTRIYYKLEEVLVKEFAAVGQEVYIVPVNDGARYIKDSIFNHITKSRITKIGRKYIYVGDTKYVVECGYIRETSNYSSWSHLFLSAEDMEEAKENSQLMSVIQKFFTNSSFSNKFANVEIEDKRRIAIILENYL